MRPTNLAGPAILGGLPSIAPQPPFEVAARQQNGAVLLDIRSPEAFGGAHIPRSINVGISDSLGTWVGWLFAPEQPIIFVSEEHAHIEEAVRQLIRIGHESFAGYLQGGVRAWVMDGRQTAAVPQLSVHELNEHRDEYKVLDVRQEREWASGHLEEASPIPLPLLPSQAAELDREAKYATFCGSGYRSSIAASLLLVAGVEDVSNVVGSMAAWRRAGLPVVR